MSETGKKSLGEFLKSERERRGLTIEQTSSATKIGLKVLKQLEADQYASLPALPFVRGFVRNYGKFLGLDGEKLLAEYAEFLESHASERPKRDAGHSGYAFERPEGEQSRKILWGVMAGMLVFGGAVVFIFKPSLKHKRHGHIDKLKPSGGEESGEESAHEGAPVASPSASPSATPSVSPSGAPSAAAKTAPSPSHTPSHVPTHAPSPEAPFVPPKAPLVLAPPAPPSPKPAPSPKSTPTSTPSPKPVPSPKAAPSPVAVPAPSPTPAASPVAEDDLKNDPLQSGRNYPPKEVRMKLVLRTKADIWVRYRCDEKKLMKFALKKDKILVLRGKGMVFVQVSNPDSITIQATGEAETPFSAHPAMFDFHGSATLAFPAQARDKIEENFKIGAPLPHTDSPIAGE